MLPLIQPSIALFLVIPFLATSRIHNYSMWLRFQLIQKADEEAFEELTRKARKIRWSRDNEVKELYLQIKICTFTIVQVFAR